MMNNLTSCPIPGVKGVYESIISIISIAVPASIAALAAYYSAKKTSENTFRYNIELSKNKLRYQIYGELIGHRYLMSQLYVLYFLSVIQSQNSRRLIEYINIKIELFNKSNLHKNLSKNDKKISSFFRSKKKILEDNKRTSIRSEELLIELAKSNELFWKTIGQIRILFDDDIVETSIKKLEDFEKDIESFEDNLKNENANEINYQTLNDDLDELALKWYEEDELKLKSYINIYKDIIDELLASLSKIIKIDEIGKPRR